MSRTLLSGMLMLGLVACSSGSAEQKAAAERAAANTAAAGNRRAPAAPAERTLASGTRIGARIQDSLSSRRDKAGETLTATVSADIEDGNGHVVIPAGSPVELMIGQLEPATNKGQADGKISLSVTSVTVRGQVYQVSADLDPVQHHLQGRGVTVGEVEKVGIGAAVGTVAGKLIGKNTKGAVIGGAIGAGAGTAVAVRYASRDVVVTPGTPIAFSLTRPLSVSTK
jgi:hypothetical protein